MQLGELLTQAGLSSSTTSAAAAATGNVITEMRRLVTTSTTPNTAHPRSSRPVDGRDVNGKLPSDVFRMNKYARMHINEYRFLHLSYNHLFVVLD